MGEEFKCSLYDLKEEEMLNVDGGSQDYKNLTYTVVGSVLVANAVFVGVLASPILGVVAFGAGLGYLGKGKILLGEK
ncbi:MAG: hypothetical protein J6Y29_04000 [Clostridiales bacterium]|nr:hypothetical protein [Clostridiales bacterium]